jgi:hypothetical protein
LDARQGFLRSSGWHPYLLNIEGKSMKENRSGEFNPGFALANPGYPDD